MYVRGKGQGDRGGSEAVRQVSRVWEYTIHIKGVEGVRIYVQQVCRVWECTYEEKRRVMEEERRQCDRCVGCENLHTTPCSRTHSTFYATIFWHPTHTCAISVVCASAQVCRVWEIHTTPCSRTHPSFWHPTYTCAGWLGVNSFAHLLGCVNICKIHTSISI